MLDAEKEVEKICPTCGKTFKSSDDRRIYCSPNCASRAHYDKMKMTHTDWDNLREFIIERDNYICQDCGIFSMITGLAVHHIIPLAYGGNNDPNNLVTLCNKCHRARHSHKYERCITPLKSGGLKSGTSRKSHMVTFRLPNEAYAKIGRALKWPSNGNTSVGDYCKQVIERYAFRHDKRKYKKGT